MKSSFKKKENPNTNKDDTYKAYFGLPEFDDILLYIYIFSYDFLFKILNFLTYF